MINVKDLSDEQVGQIRAWAEAGDQLPDIQRKLVDDLGLNATYMDTRFLVLDLGIELKQDEPEPEPEPEESDVPEAGKAPEAPVAGAPEDALIGQGGAVTITTDELARPGSVVSGTVIFSDGEKGVWFIDELGRPGLDPDTPGYEPSDADLGAFETELRKALQAP